MSSERRHNNAVFVNVDDVKDHLSEYNIFDVRFHLAQPNYNMERYVAGHIPGATPVNLDDDLSGMCSFETGRHPLPDCNTFISWCQAEQVCSDKPVLCYDEQCGAMAACRLWWLLDNLGVEVYVLNGGFQAYCIANLPIEVGERSERNNNANLHHTNSNITSGKMEKTKQIETSSSLSSSLPSPSSEASISTKWPYATSFSRHYLLHDIPPNAVVIDMRPAIWFHSTVRPFNLDAVPGHVCGSYNLPYDSFFTTFTHNACEEIVGCKLRPLDEIKNDMLQLLHSIGRPFMHDFSTCVFQCGSGVSACLAMAVVRHIGLGHPFLYCGSWSQYSNLHRFTLMRNIIQEHGFCCEMLRVTGPDAPRAVPHSTPFCAHDVDYSENDAKCMCNEQMINKHNTKFLVKNNDDINSHDSSNKEENITVVDSKMNETYQSAKSTDAHDNDEEINCVIPHLYEGEKVKVYFKSGRITVLTIFSKLTH